jgi:hypothetical protein
VDRDHPEDLADQGHPADRGHPVDPGRLERPEVPLARRGLSAPEARRVLLPPGLLAGLGPLGGLAIPADPEGPSRRPDRVALFGSTGPFARQQCSVSRPTQGVPGRYGPCSTRYRRHSVQESSQARQRHPPGRRERDCDGREREFDNSGQRQSARTLLNQSELRHRRRPQFSVDARTSYPDAARRVRGWVRSSTRSRDKRT